jgi:hypothetical protein
MQPKEELEELYEWKIIVEMRIFQKFLMEPLKKKIESLKNAYDCDNLRELHSLKGEEKGLRYVISLLKEKDNDLRNKKTEVDDSE